MDRINLNSFILYHNIWQEDIIKDTVKIYNANLSDPEGPSARVLDTEYYNIQRNLLKMVNPPDVEGSYWQNYICKLVAESENSFTLMAEKGETDENLSKLALREVNQLKSLYHLDWKLLGSLFENPEAAVCCFKTKPAANEGRAAREKIKQALETEDDVESLHLLQKYYEEYGSGIFERYDAFVWNDKLSGIKNYDKITFDQLIGYTKQKEMLIENTRFLLMGCKANNVLLYGDRGTGKSSSVKALINKFKNQKLKIISLNKNHVKDLYTIIDQIRNRGCKFIIFIDDLSFEETETGYKYFKSVIDGGIEAQPDNTLIYVTSNRRNIIRETWQDRSEGGSEVHSGDGMQERLSLADRFGLTITFSTPDKNTYLDIVRGIAKQENLTVEEDLLTSEALKWELRQHGRSGRTAKQFITHMQGKQICQSERMK